MRKLLLVLAILALAVPASARGIGDATVTIDTPSVNVGTAQICFTVQNNSTGAEWIGIVEFTFPECMTVLGGSYTDDGTWYEVPVLSGVGTNVAHWEAWTASGYGFMGSVAYGQFCVDVDIACACDMEYGVDFYLEGDGWGDPPHTLAGTNYVFVACVTPTADSHWSAVKALY